VYRFLRESEAVRIDNGSYIFFDVFRCFNSRFGLPGNIILLDALMAIMAVRFRYSTDVASLKLHSKG
jgi:hypothetical protein